MMAYVDRNPWSPDQDIILNGSEADENPANYTSFLHQTPMATDEEKMMSASNHGDSAMEELLKQQVKMQMEMIEMLMASKSQEDGVRGHAGVVMGQAQPVVVKEKNRQERVKQKVKFRLTQDQVQDIYRKAQERQRLASSKNLVGGKREADDVVICADFQRDGRSQSQDEVKHKPDYMDEELEQIQRQWRDELIKDKFRFKRAREEEESDDGNSGQAFGVKLQKVEEREEGGSSPTYAQDDGDGKRERLRQHLLMKHKDGWEKLRENEDEEEIDRKRRRNSDEEPDDKRARFLERNRAAATRCRNKRKQWITNLETKADELNNTSVKLQTEVTGLRNEVAQLKQLLLAHKDCPVTLMQRKAAQAQVEAQQQAAAAQAQQQAQVQILAGTGAADLQVVGQDLDEAIPVKLVTTSDVQQ